MWWSHSVVNSAAPPVEYHTLPVFKREVAAFAVAFLLATDNSGALHYPTISLNYPSPLHMLSYPTQDRNHCTGQGMDEPCHQCGDDLRQQRRNVFAEAWSERFHLTQVKNSSDNLFVIRIGSDTLVFKDFYYTIKL
ncbi:hypothetical protein EVAR_100684_1 [Eumeta japonica]|uniref:Uncharacterized protein n=1 Tax=Eumeta variegata TaxID=151549 RepID=A0A4C1ZUG4_EUMVA|nr:hypothetical protein EVAR_100684_1 [Eumeta japonica]